MFFKRFDSDEVVEAKVERSDRTFGRWLPLPDGIALAWTSRHSSTIALNSDKTSINSVTVQGIYFTPIGAVNTDKVT